MIRKKVVTGKTTTHLRKLAAASEFVVIARTDLGELGPAVSVIRCERGGSSFLFVGVIIPVILAMLLLSIDLAGFFQVREQVRALLDDEAELALVQGRNKNLVVDLAKSRLRVFDPLLSTSSLTAKITTTEALLSLDARYRGVVLELVGPLLSQSFRTLPVELSVAARRVKSSALIVLERVVAERAIECSDKSLETAKSYVSQLKEGLLRQGFRSVSVALTPGSLATLELLEDSNNSDNCDALPEVRDPAIAGIPGSIAPLPSEGDLVAQVESILHSIRLRDNPEKLAVIGVTRGRYAGIGYLHPLVDALDVLGERDRLEVSFLHLGIDPQGGHDLPLERRGEYGARRREVSVPASVVVDSALVTASVGYLGGDSIISR